MSIRLLLMAPLLMMSWVGAANAAENRSRRRLSNKNVRFVAALMAKVLAQFILVLRDNMRSILASSWQILRVVGVRAP